MVRTLRRFSLIALFLGILLPTLTTAIVHAATVTVTTTADVIHSPGCATDGITPPCSLRDTVIFANANTGTTIVVPAGVYTLTIPPDFSDNATNGDLNLTTNMTIFGSGADTTVIQASTTDSNAGIDRVIAIENPTMSPTVSINNVTVRNGRRTSYQLGGGGIFVSPRSTVILNDSQVSGNAIVSLSSTNQVFGGGIYNIGNLTLNNSAVVSNSAAGGAATGSGIYNESILSLNNSTVSHNTGFGGIYNAHSTTLTNSSVTDHTSTGIINTFGGILSITGGIVSNNGDINADGGGISDGGNTGSLTVTNSIIRNNFARRGAGISTGNGDSVMLTSSTLSGNTASEAGGGIYAFNGSNVTLRQSTISGNNVSAGDGGGIYTNQSNISLMNSTVSGNGASANGGAIYGNISNITLTASTLAANSSGIFTNSTFGPGAVSLVDSLLANLTSNCTGLMYSSDYNLSSDASCSALTKMHDLNSTNPLIGLLMSNGGPTQTHALLIGSPAIDRIPAAGANCPVTDQRGVTRPQGLACDIGAFEALPLPSPILRPGPSPDPNGPPPAIPPTRVSPPPADPTAPAPIPPHR